MGNYSDYRNTVRRHLTPLPPEELLMEDDIKDLPGPVIRYLHYTGAVGKPKVRSFRAEFTGAMRQKPGGGWLKIRAQQYNFLDEPARLFYIKSSLFGLPFDGFHRYEGEHAVMLIRVANLFRVVNARGEKMDQGETVTLFNDMCLLAPGSLTDPKIRWRTINELTVEATYTNGLNSITATLIFSEAGAMVNFISNDRFLCPDGKTYLAYPWSTPVDGYAGIAGRRLPVSGEAVWHMPGGLYPYIKFDSIKIDYNLSEFF
jgi:hypothetical protein